MGRINKKNVTSFIRGNSIKLLDDLNVRSMPEYQKTQVELRAQICQDCTDNGRCVDDSCRCKMPNKYYDPYSECARGKWGPMLSEKEMEDFQRDVNKSIVASYASITKVPQTPPVLQKKESKETDLTIIEIQNGLKDFGEVKAGSPLTHIFLFPNPLDRSLKIDKVTVDCGCLTSNYTKEAIQPGEFFSVTMTYDNNSASRFTKNAHVKFADKSVMPITLTLTGKGI